ncbi:hypothetical protein BKA67DRAFT_279310 [Truncatella angustata]|uniref:Uncharacterized protein n=1 Tax=Truncatella angustata TaxID=152316 RepID=A0A9P8UM06_9PEZI|nr:uncharacterized protein BKA67DRAFT_279310 [Truncatella angustata]KAH6654442.1 hypothetical protein BKA67DRAFT_279310 [Truncatella angustata]
MPCPCARSSVLYHLLVLIMHEVATSYRKLSTQALRAYTVGISATNMGPNLELSDITVFDVLFSVGVILVTQTARKGVTRSNGSDWKHLYSAKKIRFRFS